MLRKNSHLLHPGILTFFTFYVHFKNKVSEVQPGSIRRQNSKSRERPGLKDPINNVIKADSPKMTQSRTGS